MKVKKGKNALVLYGATDLAVPHFSGDMLWRTGGFKVPDPCILVEIGHRKILLMSPLEVERARKEAVVDEAVSQWSYSKKLPEAAVLFLKERNVSRVAVPAGFPHALGKVLEDNFRVTLVEPPFYPDRAVKTQKELREIAEAQRAVEVSVKKAVDFLRRCRIRGDRIYYRGRAVTSEMVRKIIDDELYSHGCLGIRSVVACGKQAADPHCEGSGPLMPHMPIVLDIFPLSMRTHYWADMTRTVFKGSPSPQYRHMYNVVLEAQLWATAQVRAGAGCYEIWKGVVDFFAAKGFPTNAVSDPPEGFFHGVGHGVGIDIHEPPRIGMVHQVLQAGNVVTVEPGLYYAKARGHIPMGGIRIEDMVVVTKTGCRNLTRFPKQLKDIIIP